MAHFIIESRHAEDECLDAHDAVAALGPGVLGTYYWSCPELHSGWAIVQAQDEQEAADHVPGRFRPNARIVRAEQMTPARLRAAHSNL